jgi:cell division protease FtsH
MKFFAKNILTGFLFLLLIIAVFGAILSMGTEEIQNVSFSNIAEEIQNENVKSITVQGNNVTAELEDGTKKSASKEPSGSLISNLNDYGVPEEQIQKVELEVKNNENFNIFLSVFLNILLPVLLIGGLLWISVRQAQRGNVQAMMFGKTLARMILPGKDKDKITFKDVAGLKEAKEELYEIVEFLKAPQKFSEMGAKVPKGVLLVGPPGTGKTLLARAVASEAEVPFLYTSGSEFVEMFVGVGASRIRDLFKTAVKNSPALIFIDELDAVGRSRGVGVGGGNDEREQTLNQILVEMDGFEANKGLIVLAATNRPDVLDQALMRPGRFDRRVTLDLPDISEREQIVKIHAKNKPLEESMNFRKIAERTPGFSGADIENLLNEAAIFATRQGKKKISLSDVLSSIDKVLMGPERKSKVITDRDKKLTAYHEGGHAILAYLLEDSDPVQKVTIIPRGRAGGYTLKLPTEDRSYYSKKRFLADIIVALGGYVAEKMIFGEVSTGPSSDLEKATEMAQQLVRRYGMSDEFGPINLIPPMKNPYDEAQTVYSQKTLEKIDAEVRKVIDEAHKKAEKLLRENQDKLELLAQELIEVETLEHDQFKALMEGSYTRKEPEKVEFKKLEKETPTPTEIELEKEVTDKKEPNEEESEPNK